MALRSGYKGFKKLLPGLKLIRPGTLGIDNDVLIPELNKIFFPRSEQAVLGAKNILPITFNILKELNTDGTWNDNVYTHNGVFYTITHDGDEVTDIALSGEATGSTSQFHIGTAAKPFTIPFTNAFELTGCPTGGSESTYALYFGKRPAGIHYADIGDGVEISVTKGQQYNCYFLSRVGANVDGKHLLPMLRIFTDPDPTYQPHAMTNRVLTDSAADQKTAINAIITAATGAADFAAFKTAMGAITPVTRSLSLTKEDITEEVKEVEPEKTVTKKRTTKKTEEE